MDYHPVPSQSAPSCSPSRVKACPCCITIIQQKKLLGLLESSPEDLGRLAGRVVGFKGPKEQYRFKRVQLQFPEFTLGVCKISTPTIVF